MKRFTTVGELLNLLSDVPENTPLYICGALGYYHEFENPEKYICLDTEDLTPTDNEDV